MGWRRLERHQAEEIRHALALLELEAPDNRWTKSVQELALAFHRERSGETDEKGGTEEAR